MTAPSPSWEQLIDRYLTAENAAGRPATTRRLRRDQLTRFSHDIDCTPGELTYERIEAWFGQQTAWALETRRSNRGALLSFLRWANKAGVIAEPLYEALPVIKSGKASPRPTPDDVWAAALAAADDRGRLMMRLAAEAGLRRSEVAKVHSRDLLTGPSLLVHGKGAKDRVIPINDDLAQAISQADGWLFPGRIDGHMTPRSVGNVVTDALPDGWTMHTLRHRFATRAYRGSRNLRAVQTLLGHASVATTERYTAVDDDEVRAAMMAARADEAP